MKNRYLWILDAGHGIDTEGKRSPKWEDGTQLFEWEFNRSIVFRLAEKLEKHKVKHHVLVPGVKDVDLPKRCEMANNLKSQLPKIIISVHGNAAGVESAMGYEVYTSPRQTKSDDVATIFFNMAQEHTDLRMRSDFSDGDPDKESRFYILIHTQMPALLTENGFFTNEKECREMLTGKYRDMIATAHLKAILHIEKFDIK